MEEFLLCKISIMISDLILKKFSKLVSSWLQVNSICILTCFKGDVGCRYISMLSHSGWVVVPLSQLQPQQPHVHLDLLDTGIIHNYFLMGKAESRYIHRSRLAKIVCIKLWIFLCLSIKMCILGAQKNRLNETVLLSTQNTCFGREIRMISFYHTLLSTSIDTDTTLYSIEILSDMVRNCTA